MARKRRSEEEEGGHENSERWLLTYSDMITLLLALFIIMYGMSTENQAKMQAMSQALSNAFNGSASEAGAGTGTGTGTGEGNGTATDLASLDPLQSIYDQLNGYIREENLENDMQLERTEHSISIRLRDALLFEGNSSQLSQESLPTLEKVSSAIQKVYGGVNHITITGNTADLGNRNAANERDSWQLSVDRAVKVLNELTAAGLMPDKMSIEGNSHYHPIADNSTKEGRAKNRRVEITITDSAN